MLTAEAFNGFKEYVKRTVAYARYKVGSTYYQTNLTKVYTDSGGKVSIEFQAGNEVSGNITVTEVQLFNTSGNLWLSKTESLQRKSTQEAIWYRFTIDIQEV